VTKHPDPIHRRRLVLHGVIKTISEQLHLEGVEPSLAFEAWKAYFAQHLWAGCSSEEVLRRDDWHSTVLRIEAWAAERGVTFGEVPA